MLGSSLPFPAGLSSTSFSSTTSRVISTLPWHKYNEHNQRNVLLYKAHCMCITIIRLKAGLTVRVFLPSCSMAHGHHPLTDFWEKSDVGGRLLPVCVSMLKLHFSGVLDGGIRWSRSNSTVPVWESVLSEIHIWKNVLQNFFLYYRELNNLVAMYVNLNHNIHLSNHPKRTCHCPRSE